MVTAPLSPADAAADRAGDPARVLLAALAVYFLLQLLLRVTLAGGVEKDEAEQLLWTQTLAWGYGHQPPLYSWLQWAVFRLTGPTVFGLALLKNALLFATYAFTWAAARRLLDPAPAAVAAGSLLLLPQIAWESQRDLTHTVLVTAAAAATLWLAIGLLQRPGTWRYFALGVALAAGGLAKYSFVLVPLALAAAALPDRRLRAALRDRRLVLSVAVAAVLVAPHALWLTGHWRDATQVTAGKLALQPGGALTHALGGTASLAAAVAGFVTPLWIVYAALFGRALWHGRAARPDGPWPAFFGRYFALLGAALLMLAMGGGAGHFKDRWMQPLLFCAPLAVLVARPDVATPERLRVLRRVLIGTALVLLLGMAGRVLGVGHGLRPGDFNLPLGPLGEALRARGVRPAAVIAESNRLAGGMRLVFPGAAVRELDGTGPAPLPGPLLLIATPPERFEALRAADPAWAGLRPTVIELPWLHGGESGSRARFAYALAPAPAR
jgi:4-amino-4-deoxy-L-arabinose transferase-like glycosyltransferase